MINLLVKKVWMTKGMDLVIWIMVSNQEVRCSNSLGVFYLEFLVPIQCNARGFSGFQKRKKKKDKKQKLIDDNLYVCLQLISYSTSHTIIFRHNMHAVLCWRHAHDFICVTTSSFADVITSQDCWVESICPCFSGLCALSQ